MFLNRIAKVTTTLLFTTLIVGCAGTLGGGIKEENRDTTGAYDGTWTVDVQKAAGKQTYGKWTVSCGDMRNTFTMRVVDGAMTLSNEKDAKKAFVSQDGVFKMILPLTGKAKFTASSPADNGTRQLMLSGKLSPINTESAGYITYGIAAMGYAGCTAKTKYTLAK